MIATIIYIIGIILCIMAVIEIAKMNITAGGKAISIIVLLLTSWIGLIVYYLYARHHLTDWFK